MVSRLAGVSIYLITTEPNVPRCTRMWQQRRFVFIVLRGSTIWFTCIHKGGEGQRDEQPFVGLFRRGAPLICHINSLVRVKLTVIPVQTIKQAAKQALIKLVSLVGKHSDPAVDGKSARHCTTC